MKDRLIHNLIGMPIVFLAVILASWGGNFIHQQYSEFNDRREFDSREKYYRSNDGNFFLNVISVTPTKINVPQDESVVIELCREPKERIVAVNNVRTFYMLIGENYQDVLQTILADGIEYETNVSCAYPHITPDKRPNKPGIYQFCQSLDFKVGGYDKTATFCSEDYEIIEGEV